MDALAPEQVSLLALASDVGEILAQPTMSFEEVKFVELVMSASATAVSGMRMSATYIPESGRFVVAHAGFEDLH